MHSGMKSWILIGTLLITLWLSWTTYQQDTNQSISAPTLRAQSISQDTLNRHVPLTPVGNIQLALVSRQSVKSETNLFAVDMPEVPIVAAIKPAKPAAAVAPPLPFKYVGRWQDDDQNKVMLSLAGEMLLVKPGDIVANQYRLISVEDRPTETVMKFVYIPLNQTQVMLIGKPNHG